VENGQVKRFLAEKNFLINKLHEEAEYGNLRNLKQIIIEFERIFEALPERVREKNPALEDILKTLIAFSIEIRRASLRPSDITSLHGGHSRYLPQDVDSPRQKKSISHDEEKGFKKQAFFEEILRRYSFLDYGELFPSSKWWQTFFDKGIIDVKELENSIYSSKHFQDENTPDWIRLWHYSDLSDDDFDVLLERVLRQYEENNFLEIGEIKHVFGLLLMFSDEEIYPKSKQEILDLSKKYIDNLKRDGKLELLPVDDFSDSYQNLVFQGFDFQEFKEFCAYIKNAQIVSRQESKPEAAQHVLAAMRDDVWKFRYMISLDSSLSGIMSGPRYYDTPILNYIPPQNFVNGILDVPHRSKNYVFGAIAERYRYNNLNENLLQELDWIQNVRNLILEEAEIRQKNLTKLVLRKLTKHYFEDIIAKLDRCRKNSKDEDKV
jgi:hypothetical protein